MLGALISAGSSLLGGILGNRAAAKARDQEYARQVQFAKKGIQWKVQDATKAGIHPLYALGANTISYSPSSVGDSLGPAIASAGQDIGRAVDTGRSSGERVTAFTHRAQALSLQRMELENAKLASEIAVINQPGTAPAPVTEGAVIPGQSAVVSAPHEIVGMGSLGNEPGIMTEQGYVKTGDGRYTIVMSQDAKQRMEEDLLGNAQWQLRNRIAPALGVNVRPPFKAPWGREWKFHPASGEYILVPKPRSGFLR